MKKVGIITHYYKNRNYGGNLQAYALSRVLLNCGYEAEQICCIYSNLNLVRQSRLKRMVSNGFLFFLKTSCRYAKKIIARPFEAIEAKKCNLYVRRKKAFSHFIQETIPHSDKIYNNETIKDCIKDYDIFITGSDQVWNVNGYMPAYFLDFVPSSKIKFSYAASIAKDSLTEEQKQIFLNSLKDYKAVSVREKSAKKLLEGLSPVDVQVVLDPTLLLIREDWDKVCAERVVGEEYLFCYFLGDNRGERKLAEKFARNKGLKLVVIPHAAGVKLIDRKFGDQRLYDVSPEQFLSLIKHAKYVFTDSFHAVVFSYIYQKQYFVFNRNKQGEMSSRIVDITELFHHKERFCVGKERENMKYIASLSNIDYEEINEDFEQIKKKSIEFLEKNLKD